ncbi:MAG: hypothetical protein K6E42_04595 [Synergistes sp.]|nr:hypothetical protein [Synergistes sp.]
MKKFLSIILIMIMALAIIGSAAAKPEMLRKYSADALEDAEVLAFIPFGEAVDEIGFTEADDGNIGPEAFAINDSIVYILDSVKNRIAVVNDSETEFIPVEGGYLHDICVIDGIIYLVDTAAEGIRVIDDEGLELESILLPDDVEMDDLFMIYAENGSLAILTNELICYTLADGSDEWVEAYDVDTDGLYDINKIFAYSGKEITVNTGCNTLAQYLYHTDNTIVVGVYEFVPYLPVIESELTVREYGMDGSLIGCTVFDYREAFSIPNKEICFFNNEIYALQCREEGVYVTKPNMRTAYESHMDELTAIAEEIFLEDQKQTPMRYTTVTPYTRQEVRERAVAAAEYEWYLCSGNNDPDSGISFPPYVANAEEGDLMVGIPYCWGGYFLDLDTGFGHYPEGHYTGNTDHVVVSNTIGLDCSGFACYAYGKSHNNTYWFKNTYGHYINGNEANSHFAAGIANLREMDFLVIRSSDLNHVVLFDKYADPDGNGVVSKVWVYDANSSSNANYQYAGKVANRTKNIADMSGYVMRSPWGCGGYDCNMVSQYDANNHWEECSYHCGNCTEPEPHTLSGGYEYDDNGHWKVCTDGCGYTTNCEGHTWGVANLKYWEICSVCGYMKYIGSSKLSAAFENYVPDCK